MLRRYAAGCAVGATIVVSLAGCKAGGDGTEGTDATKVSAAQAIGLASQKTATVNSYKVDVTAAGTGQAASKMHGVIQIRIRPDVAATGLLDQASVHGQSMPGSERAILLGDAFYAKVPQQLSQFTGGKPWVKFSVSDAAKQSGIDIEGLLQQANPAEQTKIFTSSKDVHKVGTSSINGDKTTHYEGTITPKEASSALDPQARKTFTDLYQQAGASNLKFNLWLGKDNLPRKLTTKVASKDGTLSSTMVFSDYNKSFNVSAPPAGEVADGSQLKNSLSGQPG